MKAKGYVLYRGPSVLDGKPIVCIATMQTRNDKTGDMVQTWILREDISPTKAVSSGYDSSVCGECVHRHHTGGACYVTVFQAPLGVWKAYHRGAYSTDLLEFMQRIGDRKVRMGAYGDPAAVPVKLWQMIADNAAGHTGYTHQWQRKGFDPKLLDYVMASVDTPDQAKKAKQLNARYFRVKRSSDPVMRGEVECLSDSVGKACADCLLCDGARDKGKSIYITVHGVKAKAYDPNLIAAA